MKNKITIVAKDLMSVFLQHSLKRLKAMDGLHISSCALKQLNEKAKSDLDIVILESVGYQEILDLSDFYRRTNGIAIFIFFWDEKIIVGPTSFPGRSASVDSALFFLAQGKAETKLSSAEMLALKTADFQSGNLSIKNDVIDALFINLRKEIRSYFGQDKKFGFIDTVGIFCLRDRDQPSYSTKYIYPLFENKMEKGELADCLKNKVLVEKFHQSKIRMEKKFFAQKDREEEVNRVAIIGGGTSGYLSALNLKKTYPELEVTLIESSKVPVIGVGEATTPEIRRFLFDVLELPVVDFYEKVKPTWKLGIKFFWGLPGDYSFNYPFGKSDIRSAYLHDKNINNSSLTSILMSTNSSFVLASKDRKGTEEYSSMSKNISYALHLDNVSFIGYLKEKALEMGVIYIDDLIVDATRNEASEEIDYVVGETGTKYSYDIFVDCSGFKSLLIEKVLKSPYISFEKSLFTDTAVTGCLPNSKEVKPYTLAESMNHGWCWNIPMRTEDHRGYVFSSAYCSIDEAADELRQKNPGIENLRTVKFRSGRHAHIAIGNVFAIGNSYAFVEPLESTGIHMIIKEVEALTKNLQMLRKSPAVRAMVNKNMNNHWDYLKGFLSIHYRFNKKFDTGFWKDCRANVDYSSIKWLVDLYDEIGLLSYANEGITAMILKEITDDIFGLTGFDTLLLGQGVVPSNFGKGFKNKSVWKSDVETWTSLQSRTVPLEKDLRILTMHPELI